LALDFFIKESLVYNLPMNLNLHINNLPEEEEKIEIVERKGLGHPDTICDLIVDQLSINLSRIYKKEFGRILHFNIDKAFLAAGMTENKFGGGKIKKPMLFIIGDRATNQLGSKKIPLEKIIKKEIYAFLKSTYRFITPKNFIIQNEIKPGSSSLQTIFKKQADFLPANDTSALVGFAPQSTLEKMVLAVEGFINSKKIKSIHPETGEDVKIMGQRQGNDLMLTIAIAFVDRFVKNEKDYFQKKSQVKKEVENFIKKVFGLKVKILINALDKKGSGMEGCYLTVLGTSADSGDSGQVGRGNRCNGLISLNRPAGSEAAAGKNCISHVGKIYNLLAFKIAEEIYQKTDKDNFVWLTSQIGQLVNQPALVSIEVKNPTGKDKDKVRTIVEENFKNLNQFINDLISGKFRTV
jgi:S-adenosylmethionine synthetase